MGVYRLEPADASIDAWRYSTEKDTVWVNAASEGEARELASRKSGFSSTAPRDLPSPWLDDRAVTCTPEPAMTYPDAGQVMRADGSLVDY